MRDFSRDAPGRIRNSASNTDAAAAQRRLLEENFTVPSRTVRGFYRTAFLTHNLERALPACLIEEVQYHFTQKQKAIAPRRLQVLIVRSLKRPINKHRPPDDVFLRNESPVTAI